MAIDVYMLIDGIKGTSTDERHRDWIECTAVNWRGQPPAAASVGGGHMGGQCEHSDIVISKLADLASPVLLQSCRAGDTIPKAKFEFMRADGQGLREKYLDIEIENVVVGAVSSSMDDGASEQVGFRFSRVKWKYAQQ